MAKKVKQPECTPRLRFKRGQIYLNHETNILVRCVSIDRTSLNFMGKGPVVFLEFENNRITYGPKKKLEERFQDVLVLVSDKDRPYIKVHKNHLH